MEAVDLTVSECTEDQRFVKRQRTSTPDGEVEVVGKPEPQAAVIAGLQTALGDEDILITRATGLVWNQDLPHSRTQCGLHLFVPSGSPSNHHHCSKCFCYICDVEANQCEQWGCGDSSNDHCNAHDGSQIYRDMRLLAQKSAASPCMPSPAAGPSGAAAGQNPAQPSAARPSGRTGAATSRLSTGIVPKPSGLSCAARQYIARQPIPGTHTRALCRSAPFRTHTWAANQAHCKLCTCYICDVLADNCTEWGTGMATSDHCNAHAGMQCYRQQREDHRTKAQPSLAVPALLEAQSVSDSEDYLSDVEAPSDFGMEADYEARKEAAKQRQEDRRQARRPKVPVRPIEPSRVLPDPSLDYKMLEIGTIHLPIRPKAPYTVTDLQERLVPTGVASMYMDDDHKLCRTTIALSTLLRTNMLELLPLPLPEDGCEPSPMRLRRGTIVSHDGRSKPLTVGVKVHKDGKLSDLLEAISQHPAAACSPDEELVLGYCYGRDSPFTNVVLVRDMSKKILGLTGDYGFVAFRLPHAKPSDEGTKWPMRVVVHSSMRNPEPGYPEFLETAHTLLFDLPGDLWKGGKEAEETVAAMIAAALAPYRKAVSPSYALNECFDLHRCDRAGDYYPLRSHSRFSETEDDLDELHHCIINDVMHLAAEWKPSGLELYETETWSKPDVDVSAAEDAIAEAEWLMKEEKRMAEVRKEHAQLPRVLLRELSRACKTFPLEEVKFAEQVYDPLTPPLAACKLSILPVEGAIKECATLTVQIFVWKIRGRFSRVFFQSPDDWLPKKDKRPHRVHEDTSGLSLKDTMHYLLKDDPLTKAMLEEMRACTDRKSYPRGITGLMNWLEAGERPEAPQPAGLTVQLHPYQRQSLRFMLDNERGDGGHRRHFWVPFKTPSGFTFWWSPVFRRACQEVTSCPWGGFLAEEMGCGKTVEILALILSNPAPPQVVSGSLTPDGCIQSRATLVVCAVSLVGQWMEEARSKLNGSLRMYQYHGQSRNRNAKKLATDYDLVVTTYQTLGSDWRMHMKKGGAPDGNFEPLGKIKWHRVVLDESHTVKAGGANQAMAVCALKADRRWCCSGTPVSTEVTEFLGQFQFLGCHPFDSRNYFMSQVKPAWPSPPSEKEYGPNGAVALLFALGRTAMRHTQQQRLGGETVCKLPEKTEEALAVEFTEAEQRLYLRVHKGAKAEFERYVRHGSTCVARNLLAIMSLLSPLRAICSGGILRERDVKVPNLDQEEEGKEVQLPTFGVDSTLEAPAEECSICLNHDMERPCRTPCLHWFCRECITAELAVRDRCPLCRNQIDMAQLREAPSAAGGGNEENDGGPANGAAPNIVASESKLRVLLDELAKMRARDPSAKALIFTQFNSTLEWLMSRLTQEGYGYRTISGSMPMKKRSQAIEAFQRDPPTTVFLLSMRSGAVGINLTAANHVFILEPAMNPALEDQAVGRAFRMGQTRPVTVRKLYIKGSVEERIIELVKSRREGTAFEGAGQDNTIGHLNEGEYEACLHKGKMRQQEVAGSISRDRQKLRLAELHLLFQDPVLPIIAGANQAEAAEDAAPAPAEHGGGD